MDSKTRKRVMYREYVKMMEKNTFEAFAIARRYEQLYPDFPMIYEEEYEQT